MKVTFIQATGERSCVDIAEGATLLDAALASRVPGIAAECGGSCACGTCHVYIGNNFQSRIAGPSDEESGMLSGVIDQTAESRLACQIKLSADLDGIEVRIPESQY